MDPAQVIAACDQDHDLERQGFFRFVGKKEICSCFATCRCDRDEPSSSYCAQSSHRRLRPWHSTWERGRAKGVPFSSSILFPGSVIGMDILFSSVQKARSRLGGVVAANACRLPFRDGAFDLVMSNAVIEHLRSAEMQREFANEVQRVGNPFL